MDSLKKMDNPKTVTKSKPRHNLRFEICMFIFEGQKSVRKRTHRIDFLLSKIDKATLEPEIPKIIQVRAAY